MKDPIEVQLPTRDRFLVTLRMKNSRDYVPSTLFDNLLLDLRYGPVIEGVVSESCTTCIVG